MNMSQALQTKYAIKLLGDVVPEPSAGRIPARHHVRGHDVVVLGIHRHPHLVADEMLPVRAFRLPAVAVGQGRFVLPAFLQRA